MTEVSFGISVNASAADGADPVADARHAEELGFDIVTVTDHLPGRRPTHETWTLLTWIAAATERIRIGTNVLGLPYRHPAVTAKMAASLQGLSRGRLVLGLGGGGTNAEFEAFGLPVRERGRKIDALEEGLEVIRRLWSGEPVTFDGEHYRLQEAQITPSPSPRIPIWLGVYGRRSIRLAARVADGWIPSYPFAPPPRRKELQDHLRRSAEEAGRDPGELEVAYNVGVSVDERAEPRERVVVGGPDRVAEALAAMVADGVTLLNLWPVGEGTEQRERLAREVVPQVRRAANDRPGAGS